MPRIPDLSDPRYLDEVGWFLYHEKYRRDRFGGSYDEERIAYSRLLRDEVLGFLGRPASWLEDRAVVSIGCGCTGDLTAFPARTKIAIDPLLYAYQQLDMLVPDEAGGRTVYLSLGAEDLPLLDRVADLVICRNALDHMPDPRIGLNEIWRILTDDGSVFVSVDIGGEPTPDEPTVFSVESLRALMAERFELQTFTDGHRPHSAGRTGNVRLLARKVPDPSRPLDKARVLQAYEARLP
ncbi:MAG TPA: methyltransferase domain-containing protein [Methylomirabilota bacterium]|nr:methyltransferase domain-containing protein [Methylomirabilota bacterium]